jgi:hypothetical protein
MPAFRRQDLPRLLKNERVIPNRSTHQKRASSPLQSAQVRDLLLLPQRVSRERPLQDALGRADSSASPQNWWETDTIRSARPLNDTPRAA